MLEAPTLDHVLNHPKLEDGAGCCILIAPIFTKVGKDEVIPRIGYLDGRTGGYVHFYCAGYGGYWHPDTVPDMQEIGDVKYKDGVNIPWAFSQELFGKFVTELESSTSWNYSGNSELILLSPDLDFKNVLVLYIDAMVKDGAIINSAEIFEAIIKYCREAKGDRNAFRFSDKKGLDELGKMSLESLLSLLPKPVQGAWMRGKHYAVRDISK